MSSDGRKPKQEVELKAVEGPDPRGAVHIFFKNNMFWMNEVMLKEVGDLSLVKGKHIINFFKACTLPYVLGLCYHFDNFQLPGLLYAAMHGSYGWLWLVKDQVFPDASFEAPVTITGFFGTTSVLAGYWVAPYLLISNPSATVSNMRMPLCTFFSAVGLTIMMLSDMQKYYTLKFNKELAKQKKLLVNDGFFSHTRNPNYLGEMILYSAFAGLVPGRLGYFGWGYLVTIWSNVFLAGMYRKEESLMKKPGWAEYRKRSWMLLPRPGFLAEK